jgi:hypothetical protein
VIGHAAIFAFVYTQLQTVLYYSYIHHVIVKKHFLKSNVSCITPLCQPPNPNKKFRLLTCSD